MSQDEAVHLADFKILIPRNKPAQSPNKPSQPKPKKTKSKKK